jgi:beta-lactamase regulating signal transducer with metallopeptidase domain
MNFLFDLLIKSNLLMLVILAVLPLLKNKSAGLRHWIISLGMLSLICLPLGRYCIPDLEVALLPSETISQPVSKVETSHNINENLSAAPTSLASSEQTKLIASSPNLPAPVKVTYLPKVNFWKILPALFVLISCLLCFRFLLGLFAIRKISRHSQAFEHPALKEIIVEISRQYKHIPAVQVLVSQKVQTPMTWGLFRAKIAMPHDAENWSYNELRTVLLHEMAHIDRQDYQLHLITQLALCLYWFNPLFWILKNRQLLEREKACDELVVSKGVAPHDYAEQLISFAKQVNQQRQLASSFALPMAQASQMKQRILAILDSKSIEFLNIALAKRKWALFFVFTFPILAAISLVAKPITQEFPIFLPIENNENEQAEEHSAELQEETITEEDTNVIQTEEAIPQTSEAQKESVDTVQLLPAEPQLLEKLPLKTLEIIEEPTSEIAKINGWFGQWKEGATHYTVWTLGDYKLMDIFPFIEPASSSDLVIIETQKGDANHVITLTRAPYYGGLIQSYLHGEPNAWSGFKANDLLIMQIENGRWNFSFSKSKKWSRKLKAAEKQLQNIEDKNVWQPAQEKLNYWKPIIEKYQDIKEKRYRRYEEFEPHIQATFGKLMRGEATKKSLNSISYQAPSISISELTKEKRLGYTNPSSTTAGFSGYEGTGYKFGTIVKGNNKPCQLKEFNFHVRYVTFKEVKYQLHLFAVEDGKPTHSLLQQAIPGTLKATKKGWINLDLSAYNVISEGQDILAVIELTHTPAKGGFFLSSVNYFKGMFLPKTDLSEYDIWSERFTFNFLVAY